MKILADIWRDGKGGVTQDGNKAVEYLTTLAEKDNSSDWALCKPNQALYELGTIYEEGCGSVAPDMQKAIDFYQKSAKLEYWEAKMKLEELTRLGIV